MLPFQMACDAVTQFRNHHFWRVGRWTVAVTLALLARSVISAPAQTLKYRTSWAGNTFGGARYTTIGGWTDNKHVQLNISDLYVDADGTLYTDSFWDEGGYEAGIYKNGDEIGRCADLSHGWGRQGGYAVTVDADYIYVDMTQNGDDGGDNGVRRNRNNLPVFPPRGTQWYCLRRFHKNGTSAPFPTGYGEWGDMMIFNRATSTAGRFPAAWARGLAIHNGLLYLSDPYHKRIAVYSVSQMSGTPVREWTVESPGKITFDAADTLWVLQTNDRDPALPTERILHFDADGKLLPEQILFAPTVIPAALAWNRAAGRLMVADQGRDQNIKLYDPKQVKAPHTPSPHRESPYVLPTAPASTFGVPHGIHGGLSLAGAKDGQVGPLRLFDPVNLGADAAGNIYVVNSIPNGGGPGISLESYTPTGHRNWALRCLEFVNCVDADPQSDTDVYSTNKHYVLDYSQPNGSNWSFRGLTLDRFKYPDDPRLHRDFAGGCWVRRINGAKYLFLTQQMGHELCVLRFNQTTDGETAIPYAFLSNTYHAPGPDHWPAQEPGGPNQPTDWIWRDANGNGQIDAGEYAFPAKNSPVSYDAGWGVWVDRKGDIWQSGHGHIRHFKMHLDGNGRPAWDYMPGNVELLDPPALPNGAHWQHGANGDNDDMDRVVYDPATDTMLVSGFTSDYPDDSGQWGDTGRVVYRYDHWSGGGERKIHPGYPIVLPWGDRGKLTTKSISVEGGYLFAVQLLDPETVTVYDLNTAQQIGTLTPGPEVGNRGGWVDANFGLSVRRRSTGEYLIFVEEDLNEKALIYRWTPPHAPPHAKSLPQHVTTSH